MSVVDFLKKVSKDKIKFTKHSKERLKERGLSEAYLRKILFRFEKLKIESKQDDTYVLIYEISRRYNLVIFLAIDKEVRVISAFKTSKKIQKLIKRFGGYYMIKKYKF